MDLPADVAKRQGDQPSPARFGDGLAVVYAENLTDDVRYAPRAPYLVCSSCRVENMRMGSPMHALTRIDDQLV